MIIPTLFTRWRTRIPSTSYHFEKAEPFQRKEAMDRHRQQLTWEQCFLGVQVQAPPLE